jgi:hypothetical protein
MPATDSGHRQHVIVDVADQLFAAIERSDEATLNELFNDDIASTMTSRCGGSARAAITTKSGC